MKNLEFKELNAQELEEVNGGGKWNLGEAAIAFALLGLLGVGFYTLRTMQG